jgi:hypothetical protein
LLEFCLKVACKCFEIAFLVPSGECRNSFFGIKIYANLVKYENTVYCTFIR